MLRRRSPLRRRKPIRQKITPKLVRYYDLRRIFLELHPVCQICHACHSRDVHHRKGRYGKLLNDTLYWMALCRSCHDWVHDHSIQARKLGYLVRG